MFGACWPPKASFSPLEALLEASGAKKKLLIGSWALLKKFQDRFQKKQVLDQVAAAAPPPRPLLERKKVLLIGTLSLLEKFQDRLQPK